MTDFFSQSRPGRQVTHGEARFTLPILYHRDDCFAAFFSCDGEAARAAMPSERLHPVRLPGGRAIVAVAAFNYLDTSIGPYGEVGVVVPAVYGRHPAPPLLPGLFEARWPGFGTVVLHLPVTRQVARDAGRGQWGYTKFVADMDFRITPERLRCRLRDGQQPILTLRVPRGGLTLPDGKPLVTYSVRDGALLRTTVAQRGTARSALRPRGASLELGDHPLADTLRELDAAPRPFLTRYYVERAGILPAGEVVEQGVRPLEGWPGDDREGELTVSYL
jgi:hypothetical protein